MCSDAVVKEDDPTRRGFIEAPSRGVRKFRNKSAFEELVRVGKSGVTLTMGEEDS